MDDHRKKFANAHLAWAASLASVVIALLLRGCSGCIGIVEPSGDPVAVDFATEDATP